MTNLNGSTARLALAPLLVLAIVSACSSGNESSAVVAPTIDTTPTVMDIVEDVGYYGACGNETLVLGASTYYPLLADDLAEFDPSRYRVDLVEGARSGFGGQPLVPNPGPGDDTGTLVVYDDGMARFESDSGRVIWLTIETRTYNWVC